VRNVCFCFTLTLIRCVSSTVATYQTLLRVPRLQKFDPAGLKAIIVDEAHHAAAPSYRQILSHFNSSVKNPRAVNDAEGETLNSAVASPGQIVPIIGFSATFSRHDGLALGSVFDRIVYHRDFLDMIKEQWSYMCFVLASIRTDIDSGIGYAMYGSPVFRQISTSRRSLSTLPLGTTTPPV